MDYDPETGVMTWKSCDEFPRQWNTRYAGKPAFSTPTARGYLQGSVDGQMLAGHRVAWAITHGAWPTHEIDHINGDRSDNRLINLRDIPHIQNQRNMIINRSNTSGVMGVNYHKRDRRWRAFIEVRGKSVHLGNFKTINEAAAARKAAERKHGFMPEHGKAAA
ncbi:HNH endonuclease [Qipengyuania sp. MTN3-11]|uniref:HNH endonuclease n=1 Tax=Qipengyuania sp. MTN3-11 TaxID=3056557 RepID=UPI0036F43EA6